VNYEVSHADLVSKYAAPWVRNRGIGRLLAQETNVSDLIQLLILQPQIS
jgi:hypothetical protein